MLPGIHWQVASTGSLGLNNEGDTITLFNAQSQLIDQVNYGSIGNADQSITLYPDGEGDEFVLHSTLEHAQGALFSPGRSVNSELVLVFEEEGGGVVDNNVNPVVPELPTLLYFAIGWSLVFIKRYTLAPVSTEGIK